VNSADEDGERRCHVTYGDVIDKAARKNISICRGQDGQGLSHRVYVSQSNSLQIVFNTLATASTQQHQHNFIVHVEGERFKLGTLETFSLAYIVFLFPIFFTFLPSSSVHVLAFFLGSSLSFLPLLSTLYTIYLKAYEFLFGTPYLLSV